MRTKGGFNNSCDFLCSRYSRIAVSSGAGMPEYPTVFIANPGKGFIEGVSKYVRAASAIVKHIFSATKLIVIILVGLKGVWV